MIVNLRILLNALFQVQRYLMAMYCVLNMGSEMLTILKGQHRKATPSWQCLLPNLCTQPLSVSKPISTFNSLPSSNYISFLNSPLDAKSRKVRDVLYIFCTAFISPLFLSNITNAGFDWRWEIRKCKNQDLSSSFSTEIIPTPTISIPLLPLHNQATRRTPPMEVLRKVPSTATTCSLYSL